jgi:hypothetical protein
VSALRIHQELDDQSLADVRAKLAQRARELARKPTTERERLIESGLLTPRSDDGPSPTPQRAWVDAEPCLTLREPPREVPRTTSPEELDGIQAREAYEREHKWQP